MNDLEGTVEVTNQELLARLERLEALLAPRLAFLEELETSIKNHPMARGMMGL